MNTDFLLALTLIAAAIIGWLTAAAQLADMTPGLSIIKHCWRAFMVAYRAIRRTGWSSVDAEALRRAVRPVVRAATSAAVFAAAPAALWELVTVGNVGRYGVALCLSLAIAYATTTPCPWLRFVLQGDRRREQQPLSGEDRRDE